MANTGKLRPLVNPHMIRTEFHPTPKYLTTATNPQVMSPTDQIDLGDHQYQEGENAELTEHEWYMPGQTEPGRRNDHEGYDEEDVNVVDSDDSRQSVPKKQQQVQPNPKGMFVQRKRISNKKPCSRTPPRNVPRSNPLETALDQPPKLSLAMEQTIQKRQEEKNAEVLVLASNLPADSAPSQPSEPTVPQTELVEQDPAHDQEMASVKVKMNRREAEFSKSHTEIAFLEKESETLTSELLTSKTEHAQIKKTLEQFDAAAYHCHLQVP